MCEEKHWKSPSDHHLFTAVVPGTLEETQLALQKTEWERTGAVTRQEAFMSAKPAKESCRVELNGASDGGSLASSVDGMWGFLGLDAAGFRFYEQTWQ